MRAQASPTSGHGLKGKAPAWLTWHKRHLWPSKPLVITGELTEDGKVKSVEMLKENLAALKDRGVDFLVTPGEPGAKDPEGLIKVPGEGKKFEEWVEACEKKLREEHDIYVRHLWANWSDLAGLEEKREDFIGRQWLRQVIEAWTEGHVNRLKLIKRKMFGRAKLDLLRIRVMASGP